MKDLATASICIHACKLNCGIYLLLCHFFFLRLRRRPNGPRPVYMLSAIFREDLFSFEFRRFLREVDRKRGREGKAHSGKKGGGECCASELANTGEACVLRVF